MTTPLEKEIEVAHMLNRIRKQRLAVISVGSVICVIPFESVEPHETVLYVTI